MSKFGKYVRTGARVARAVIGGLRAAQPLIRRLRPLNPTQRKPRLRRKPYKKYKKVKVPVLRKTGDGVYSLNSRSGYTSSKVTTRKQNPRMLPFVGAMKHVLSAPRSLMHNGQDSINNLTFNGQGTCEWYSHSALRPQDYDAMLSQGDTSGYTVPTIAQFGYTGMTGYSQVIFGGVKETLVDSNFEIFIDNIIVDSIYKNSASHQCQFTMWECTPRKDIPLSMTNSGVQGHNPSLLASGFTNMQEDSLADSFDYRVPGSTDSIQTAIGINTYNATPFQSSQWCRMFSVKQICNKILNPGDEVRHYLKDRRSRLVSKSKYGVGTNDTIKAQYSYLRDLGKIILIRVQGTAVHNENLVLYASTNENHLVTTGTYSLDYVQTKRISYRVPQTVVQRRTGQYGGSLPTYTGATGLAPATTGEDAFQVMYAPEIGTTG